MEETSLKRDQSDSPSWGPGVELKELVRHISSTEDVNSGHKDAILHHVTNEAEKESVGSRQVWLQGESQFALVPDLFWLMVPWPWMARLHLFVPTLSSKAEIFLI